MTIQIAFTGSRKLEPSQTRIIEERIEELKKGIAQYHVGDARGVDAVVLGQPAVSGLSGRRTPTLATRRAQ